jgi:hypothetical protein
MNPEQQFNPQQPQNNPVPQPEPIVTPLAPQQPQNPYGQQPVPVFSPQPLQPVAPVDNTFQPPAPVTPQFGGQKQASPKKKLIIIAAAVVALLMIAGGIIVAVSGKDDDKKTVNTNTNNSEKKDNEATKDSTSTSTPTEKKLDQTLTDPDVGYTIKVNRVIRNVPFNANASYASEGNVGVLIELTVTNASKLSGSIDAYDLELVTGTGATESDYSYYFTEYATSKGYTFLSDQSVKTGDTATVWVAYNIPKTAASSLKLRYDRPETKVTVIGGDDYSIAALKVEVPID